MELVVVMAIFSVLMVAGIGGFVNIRMNARNTQRKNDLKEVMVMLENFKRAEGTYPVLVSGQDWDDLLALLSSYLAAGAIEDPLNNTNYYYSYYDSTNLHTCSSSSYELCAFLEPGITEYCVCAK